MNERLPALRSVDVVPVEGKDGEMQFALHDRLQITKQTLAVSPAGYFVLAHLDGKHTCADIQQAFLKQAGMRLPAEEVMKLVRVLDDALLLEGERFEQAYADQRVAYGAAAARDNRHRYAGAGALRAEIEALLARGVAAPVEDVRGVIAPHLDYGRGGPCYADAYATLAAGGPAERYVILGTNHVGRGESVVATGKDFVTPLGTARTDRGFLAGLEQEVGRSLREDESDHRHEHSVELHVHVLQVLRADREFDIVPVLCPNLCISSDERHEARRRSELDQFAGALQRMIERDPRRTILIAGADLSHIGQRFGDETPATPERLAQVGAYDRQLLSLLEKRDEAALVEMVQTSGNDTKICSVGCIYTLLRALPERPCRVLAYHQAADYESDVHVTCVAAVVG